MRSLAPVTCVCLSLLAGCTGISPDRLATEGATTTFDVGMPVEATYRRVVEGSRACYVGMFDVTADFFPADQAGNVTASMKSLTSAAAVYVVNVKAAPAGAVVTINAHPSAPAIAQNVKAWIDSSEYSACGLKSYKPKTQSPG